MGPRPVLEAHATNINVEDFPLRMRWCQGNTAANNLEAPLLIVAIHKLPQMYRRAIVKRPPADIKARIRRVPRMDGNEAMAAVNKKELLIGLTVFSPLMNGRAIGSAAPRYVEDQVRVNRTNGVIMSEINQYRRH